MNRNQRLIRDAGMSNPYFQERPTTPGQWRPYLAEFSKWYLDRRGGGDVASNEKPVEEPWLGFEPATPEQISAVEARLGVALPPTLRGFLLTSNGFKNVSVWVEKLSGCDEIDWFRETHENFIEGYENSLDEEELDEESEWLDVMRNALTIAEGEDVWLLDTTRRDGDGECPALCLSVKYGEFEPHESFSDLVIDGRRQIADLRDGS